MADAYTWIKGLPDILRSYGLLIMSMIALVGTSTGGYQYMDKQAAIEDKNNSVREVAIAFQKMIPEAKPEKKAIIYRSDCNYCKTEIEKLKRWHE